MKIPAEILIFILSSFIASFILSFSLRIISLQQIILVLFFMLIIFINYILFRKLSPRASSIISYSFLLFISLFTQLMVASTGGFQSPFFILLHLFILATGILVNPLSATIFFFSSATVLFINLYMNHALLQNVYDDPGTFLISVSSLLVTVPLSILFLRHYKLQDKILRMLERAISIEKAQQRSLLSTLNELIFITDLKLNVISTNQAVEKMLGVSGSQIINIPLFQFLFLKDANNRLLDKQLLPIQQAISEKNVQKIDHLLLYAKNNTLPQKVSLHIRPLLNINNTIDQLMFVISKTSEFTSDKNFLNEDLEEARAKHHAMVEQLKNVLKEKQLAELAARVEIIKKTEEDIFNVIEIESNAIQIQKSFIDIATLCKELVHSQQYFAQTLKTNLTFEILHFGHHDITRLIPHGYPVNPSDLTGPFFTVKMDIRWINVVIIKLIDIAILIASSEKNQTVHVTLDRLENTGLVIHVSFSSSILKEHSIRLLFLKYYQELSLLTNLKLGSGLEGYIAKTVSTLLEIPLEIDYKENTCTFALHIPRFHTVYPQ